MAAACLFRLAPTVVLRYIYRGLFWLNYPIHFWLSGRGRFVAFEPTRFERPLGSFAFAFAFAFALCALRFGLRLPFWSSGRVRSIGGEFECLRRALVHLDTNFFDGLDATSYSWFWALLAKSCAGLGTAVFAG